MLDSILFPAIEPLRHGHLPVDELHTLYWECCGNPAGIPVLFLHGGPGSGVSATSRRFFDPERYHIILLDQRGSGRSTPLGELRNNTTAHLIADIEALRSMLGIEQWLVFGGSWGSTLALAYSETHPEHCLGLVLRGIWLGSEAEIDWWVNGIRMVFPDAWARYVGHIPEAERDDLLAAYGRRLFSDDPALYLPAARAWAEYENVCAQLLPPSPDDVMSDALVTAMGRLEAWYFNHRIFLPPDQLLNNVARIRHLPCFIAHGRYDMVCPLRYAFQLQSVWPEVKLHVVPDAGHTAGEPGIAHALVAATNHFARHGHFQAFQPPAFSRFG